LNVNRTVWKHAAKRR